MENNIDNAADMSEDLEHPNARCFLALKNSLTETQIMDQETINWIKRRTKPNIQKIKSSKLNWIPISWSEIEPFVPSREDYLVKSTFNSIHGIMHTLRVLVYAAILCKEKNINEDNTHSVLEAVKFHDTCRLNDKKDLGHGERASMKGTNRLSRMLSALTRPTIPTAIIIRIVASIANTPCASVPVNTFVRATAHNRTVKMADAISETPA